MAVTKLTSPVTQNDAIKKINEIIDNLGGGGGGSVDPATASPLMDGTAAVGTSVKYAREDHVHPSDTAKADATTAVTGVTYDSTNKKITKTINGSTTDVVTIATLMAAMGGLLDRGSLTNFNNVSTDSIGVWTYASTATGRPPVSAGGVALILAYSNTYRIEIAFPNDNVSTSLQPRIYVRTSYATGDSSWRDWYRIPFGTTVNLSQNSTTGVVTID